MFYSRKEYCPCDSISCPEVHWWDIPVSHQGYMKGELISEIEKSNLYRRAEIARTRKWIPDDAQNIHIHLHLEW